MTSVSLLRCVEEIMVEEDPRIECKVSRRSHTKYRCQHTELVVTQFGRKHETCVVGRKGKDIVYITQPGRRWLPADDTQSTRRQEAVVRVGEEV